MTPDKTRPYIRNFLEVLWFDGEFGAELTVVIPYAYYMHTRRPIATISSKDTACFYYFSPTHSERYTSRHYATLERFPNRTYACHDLDYSQWEPPPYKSIYANSRFVFDKPLLVITNKHDFQWGLDAINSIDLPTLKMIFDELGSTYQIVYSRPQSQRIVNDDCVSLAFADHALVASYPGILDINLLHEQNPDLTFNTLQCMLYANCNAFISVQGGSSVLASYFGGTNIVYAKAGSEVEYDSYSGYFRKFSGCDVRAYGDMNLFLDAVLTTYRKEGQ